MLFGPFCKKYFQDPYRNYSFRDTLRRLLFIPKERARHRPRKLVLISISAHQPLPNTPSAACRPTTSRGGLLIRIIRLAELFIKWFICAIVLDRHRLTSCPALPEQGQGHLQCELEVWPLLPKRRWRPPPSGCAGRREYLEPNIHSSRTALGAT